MRRVKFYKGKQNWLIEKAISKAGSERKLGVIIRVSRQAVNQYRKENWLLSFDRLNLILNFLKWNKNKIKKFIKKELDKSWGISKSGAYMRRYRKTHPKYKPVRIDYKKRLREKAIQRLGGPICANCGCTINKILEINHIKGKGRQERKKYQNYHSFFRDIINEKVNIRDFNTLCRVCNAKHYVENELGVKGYKIEFRPL